MTMRALLLGALYFWMPIIWAAEPPLLEHDLRITLDPSTHTITASDHITLPTVPEQAVEFLLHAGLAITSPNANLEALAPSTTNAISPNAAGLVPTQRYRVTLNGGQSSFTLHYRGTIFHPVSEEGEDYARGFDETPGVISPEGVFLAQQSRWYPQFNFEYMRFAIEATVPAGWLSVSQGKRTQHRSDSTSTTTRWEERAAQQEIYLIANRYTEYSQAAGAVEAMVYVRQAEPALAQKYLDATAQYIEMYRALIGPYPYAKFALVENFWETGYGMPSFTLLGSKVLRLPFIIATSYPHEILHNWWGNGVYVDYASGNWAEGLTSYLADHLLKEQQNEGATFRRDVLQNYADFVSHAKDFPLTEFRSRHSSSSEAVGYGKTQMLFHMLRRELGDAVFVKALHQFYLKNKFKSASFADVESAFSSAADKDLREFFTQWVTRSGAPQLRVRDVTVVPRESTFELRGVLEQMQDGAPYTLNVPLNVTLADSERAVEHVNTVRDKQSHFSLMLPARPLRLDVDPQFDLFRRLDRAEIPPALSQAFGAETALIVLPAQADSTLLEAYRQLAQTWTNTQSSNIEIKLDRDLDALPTDRAVWLLGWDNAFTPTLRTALRDYPVSFSESGVTMGGNAFTQANDAVVLTARNPTQPQHALVWVASSNAKAIPGLTNKLPHYRKYSYLAFTGEEPTNSAKGQWPVVNSPMTVLLDGSAASTVAAKPSPRVALAQLPSLFSSARMLTDVRVLADTDKEGRALGSRGLDVSAEYIAEQFRAAGLQPGGDGAQSFMQTWTEFVPTLQRDVELKNIIGILPGHTPAYAGQSVVISAHYDHLGMGDAGAHAVHRGQLHPGADDNASGVAVMLELARLAAQKWQPERTLVFVAFTGEENERLGSRYYVRHTSPYPAAKAVGVLNLDTVGRLGDAPLTIFGTGSAKEWVHIFRGAQFVTGIDVKPVATDIGSSDQRSFIDIGIPGVQLFGTVHSDFHRPSDTIDRVDTAGMVKVAMILKEAAEYLATRPETLTAQIATAVAPTPPVSTDAPSAARQVSLGTVPDYAFSGPGVRVSDIVPGSSAAQAGLLPGDVLLKLNGHALADLPAYSQHLRQLTIGQTVSVTFQRTGQLQEVQMITMPR